MRLDRFLAARFAGLSRALLARGIREGGVAQATGRTLRASSLVRAGEELIVTIPALSAQTPEPPMPPVLYDDGRVVVVDKPAGLLVHPTGTAFAWSVIGLARHRWPGRDVMTVHRLDRDTSGTLALTLEASANRSLKEAVRLGRVGKEYEAVVRGVVPWDSQTVDAPIGPADGPIRIQMAVRSDGQSARTDVHVVARGRDATRVRLTLHTGRTHQIRVHLAHLGHPILGDRMYGVPVERARAALEDGVDVSEEAGWSRQALHAAHLALPGVGGPPIAVTSPWPADLVGCGGLEHRNGPEDETRG